MSKKPKKPTRKKSKKTKPSPTEAPPRPAPTITPHPTAGKKVTDFENVLDQQLNDQGQEPRRGRGRPRKELEPEAPEVGIDIISGAVKIPFDLWAKKVGVNELALTDTEAGQLANPVKQLLDYYAPRLPAIAIAWASLAVVSYTILSYRLEVLSEIRKQQSAPLSDDSTGPGAGPGQGPSSRTGQGTPGAGPSSEFPTGKIEVTKL